MNLTLIEHLDHEAGLAARMCARYTYWGQPKQAARWATAWDTLNELARQANLDMLSVHPIR